MTSRIILSFLIVNVLTAFTGQAQVTRNFEDRVSYNVNGNITMIGNTLFTCASSVSNCQSIQNGNSNSSNNLDMVYVNVDSAAGYNNSSSATLTIPVGASVLHAELYWSGRHNETATNRDRIRIKAPGSGSYTRVTAHTIDTYSNEGSTESRPYQASADITQIVVNAGSGSYTVADLKAKTGKDSLGYYGGWAIAVVYQDNSQPFRRLMLFDGAARVVGNNTVSITTDNLVTPYSGAFNTYLGALVWEGDQSITGDAFVFENNTLSDSLNPSNNYWNSSITAFNSRVTNKNPDYVNQLAMDLVMTDVSGLLANGETQANIDFVTSGDSYFPHALAFVTDLYLPDFDSSMDKTATDLNGGQVEPGDIIEYRVAFENTGQDVAINTVVSDSLPNGVTYVPNSLEIVTASVGPAGAVTDTSGDDAGEYDSNSNTVTFWVGNNAAPNQGGDFLPGQSAVVKFLAAVDEQNSNSITNTARIDFNAQTNPNEPLLAEDDATINVVANASIEVLKTAQLSIDNGNPGTADADDQITFSITVNNNGNLSMSNIALTDAMAPAGVNCPSTTLAAMSSMQCDDYTYNVSQNDMNTGGFIENTVNLTSIDGVGGNHQSSDSTQTAITLMPPVITSPTDGDLINDNTPTVSGTGRPGAIIDVLTNQGSSCQATVNPQGNWSCDISPALTDGSVIISAFASDGGNNQSATDSVTVDLDATAPDPPGVNAPSNGQPISGTGEPGATVTVVTDNGDSCTAVVDNDGNWSCDLGPGVVHGDNITVTQEDEAGNVSAPTVISGGIDTAPPANAVVTGISDDTGASGNDFITNDNTLLISGTAEADATVEVFVGGVSVGTTTADGSGNWTFDYTGIPLADGDYAITTVVTDVAGNDSGTSTAQTVRIDTTAPSAPIIIAPSNGAPVTGTGEPGATVHVTTPGGASCSTTVENDGSWSCHLSGTLVNGDDITATQTDEAGNESDPTTESGGLDTEAPDAPSIDTPINGSTINNASPTIGGTAEANSTVTVTNQNGPVCVAQTNANGDWSCVPDSPLADGLHQLQAVAKDAAGNESQPGSSQFTLNSGSGYTLVFVGIDNLVTTETGGSDTFTIALPLTPSADVTVNLSSSDTTEGTISPASVTFTTANWNQPVEITVTGVDDQVYDQDQPYTINFSDLSSADSNYNGVAINSIDVINEDDDAQPDLSVFITNCIDGSLPQQPVSYYLTVSNEGNTDIQGARVTTVLPTNISANGWQWDCVDQNGQACQPATGQGDLDELIDLNSNESMQFTFVADVQGELYDFIDAASNIKLPMGETDVNPNNNQAQDSDLLYQFLFKDGFECAAPGTIETTNQQLEQLLNLSY